MRRDSPRALSSLLTEQQKLAVCFERLSEQPQDVLSGGAAMMRFAAHEDASLSSALHLIEPSVRAEMAEEHREFAEDLNLLDWLMRSAPDADDTAAFAASLVRRMRQHLERDGRLLQRAVALQATNVDRCAVRFGRRSPRPERRGPSDRG